MAQGSDIPPKKFEMPHLEVGRVFFLGTGVSDFCNHFMFQISFLGRCFTFLDVSDF